MTSTVTSRPTRGRAVAVAVVVAVVVLLALGGFLVFDALTGSHHDQVPELKRQLARIPVPAGATLLTETAYEANGDASAYAGRQYRLPASPSSTDQVRAALVGGAITLVDRGETVPAASAPWSSWTTTTAGDLHALPQGTTGSGVEVNWNDRMLTLSVQPGDIEG